MDILGRRRGQCNVRNFVTIKTKNHYQSKQDQLFITQKHKQKGLHATIKKREVAQSYFEGSNSFKLKSWKLPKNFVNAGLFPVLNRKYLHINTLNSSKSVIEGCRYVKVLWQFSWNLFNYKQPWLTGALQLSGVLYQVSLQVKIFLRNSPLGLDIAAQ